MGSGGPNHNVFMAYLTPFLSKISGKFTANVPNLIKSVKLGGWVGSQVWVNYPKFTVFWGLPLSSWPCSSCSQIQGGPNTQVVHVLGPYLETCLGAELLRADHMALQRNQNNLLLHKTITGHSAQRLCTIHFTNHYFLPYLAEGVSETKLCEVIASTKALCVYLERLVSLIQNPFAEASLVRLA